MDEPVEQPAKKGKGGRPKGAKNKTSEPVGRGRGKLREALEDSLTAKDIQKLTPGTKASLLAKLEPRSLPEGPTTNIRVIVRGLSGWTCEHCGLAQTGKGGAEGPPAEPLDVPASDSPPDSAAWQAAEDAERRQRHYPRLSPGPSRPAPILGMIEEDPPPPPGVPIFTVPSYLDEPEFRNGGRLPVAGVDEG